MGSKTWENIGAERGEEQGRVSPSDLVIVGFDMTEKALLVCYTGDGKTMVAARAAIIACRDETRLKPPEDHWIAQLEEGLQFGKPPAVEVYALPPDKDGIRRMVINKGRHRTMGYRDINSRRPPRSRILIDILKLPLTGDKGAAITRAGALISAAGAGNVIVDSLETRAFRAQEMRKEGLPDETLVLFLAGGGGQPMIDDLIEWSKIFPMLGEEATRQANAGTLTLSRARRLAEKSEAEQVAALAPKERGKRDASGPRPLTPRVMTAWQTELGEAKGGDGAVALVLRVLGAIGGDEKALKALPVEVAEALERARLKPSRKADA